MQGAVVTIQFRCKDWFTLLILLNFYTRLDNHAVSQAVKVPNRVLG